jgi:hypothetical protein
MLVFLMSTMGSSGEDIRIKPPKVKKPAAEEAAPAVTTEESQNLFPTDYSIIAEQNLFHPDRKIPVEKVAAAPLPTPDFVLYGTLVSEGLNVAYMEDKKSPQSTPGRANRQSALHQGESLSGFVVKEINKDKVVMVRGEETVVVNLDDSKFKERNQPAAVPPPPAGQGIRAAQQPRGTRPGAASPPTSTPQVRQAQQPFVPTGTGTSSAPSAPPSQPRRSGGGFINLFKR